MNAMPDPSSISIERLVPDELEAQDATGHETFQLHLARYRFAARFLGAGAVLDGACGVGYGSHLLAEAGTCQVTGIDLDGAAVAYAQAHYAHPRVHFEQADATTFNGGSFETIVSLETIEHVPDPEAVVANYNRLLKPGGTLVASVPITPSTDVNPYHLHDFTAATFRKMFEARGFREVDNLFQRQPYQPFKIVSGKESRLSDMRQNLLHFYATHPRAALMRLRTTLVDGFCNKYLTCAWTR